MKVGASNERVVICAGTCVRFITQASAAQIVSFFMGRSSAVKVDEVAYMPRLAAASG